MYATVRRYEGVLDPAEAVTSRAGELVPLIRRIKGFAAYYWIDAGGGVMVSTSVFRDRASAERSNRKAADWVRHNLLPVLPRPPQITSGEAVATHDVNAT